MAKRATGEILSVNYLFYGSQEHCRQQSAHLNRIFYESFLSFLGGLLEGMSAFLSVEVGGAGWWLRRGVCGGGATVAFSDTLDHREPQRAPAPLSPACR